MSILQPHHRRIVEALRLPVDRLIRALEAVGRLKVEGQFSPPLRDPDSSHRSQPPAPETWPKG